MPKECDEKSGNNSQRQTQAMVYVYVNNDTFSDNELSKSKQSIDADIDKIVLENKHFRMVIDECINNKSIIFHRI